MGGFGGAERPNGTGVPFPRDQPPPLSLRHQALPCPPAAASQMLALHTTSAGYTAAEWTTEPLFPLSFKQHKEQNANWYLLAFEHPVVYFFPHPPLSSQVPWTSSISALIILGHHCLVTSLFPLLDCESHESRARAGWITALPSAYHTQGRHSVNIHEIRN